MLIFFFFPIRSNSKVDSVLFMGGKVKVDSNLLKELTTQL